MTTPTPGADLALASAYREWFALCHQERLGRLPSHAECRDVLRAIRQAERLTTSPTFVYAVTQGAWWVEYGEEP